MEEKIKEFLIKWNEMIVAANKIEEFEYDLKISVYSDECHAKDREELISGVNKAFSDNNRTYKSDVGI